MKPPESIQEIHLISLKVLEFKLPLPVFRDLNKIVAEKWPLGKAPKSVDMNDRLAGYIENGEQLNLFSEIHRSTRDYFESAGLAYKNASVCTPALKKEPPLRLGSCWLVRQLANDFNPPHVHTGRLSGVCYLDIPKQIDQKLPLSLHDSGRPKKMDGLIQFNTGSVLPLEADANRAVYLLPKVRSLYIFPSWLLHSVAPFKGKGERLSVSFNLH